MKQAGSEKVQHPFERYSCFGFRLGIQIEPGSSRHSVQGPEQVRQIDPGHVRAGGHREFKDPLRPDSLLPDDEPG